MNPKPNISGESFRCLLAMVCILALVPGEASAYVASARAAAAPSTNSQSSKIPPDQLDSLVAPIALYPDPLLAQTLAASTYPLEIIQLQQWLAKNPGLKDQALADAVAKQPWDPSVQACAGLPDLVKRLADDIQWTTDLGNAFLAQQSDVMEAVQRMRKKAMDKGTLKSTEQQKVETKLVESKSVVVIEQAYPQVVYVPSYDPVVVYGAPVYPYPPIYYPPAGYYAAGMAMSFGLGVAMGAFWSGGWGWNCGWGGNSLYVNHYNNFNRNTNINGGNRNNIGNGNRGSLGGNRGDLGGNRGNLGGGGRGNLGGGNLGGGDSTWKHNPQHRGGAPYGDRATADRFGGAARNESRSNRQAGARQQLGRQGGNLASVREGGGLGNRPSGGPGAGNLAGGGGLGANRPSGGGLGSSTSRPASGGADRIGGRDLSRGGSSRDAFGGGNSGYNGSRARANSSRGSGSMGSRGGGGRGGGGGFSRGGGGGGFRGGGRRR